MQDLMSSMDIVIRVDLGNWETPKHDGYSEPRHVIRVEGDHVIAEVEVPGVGKEA